MLQCIAVYCRVLQCVTVYCSVLQCVAVYCGVLQCVAVCCSVLQCGALCGRVLQCGTVQCSVLQCIACCNVLQYTYRKCGLKPCLKAHINSTPAAVPKKYGFHEKENQHVKGRVFPLRVPNRLATFHRLDVLSGFFGASSVLVGLFCH